MPHRLRIFLLWLCTALFMARVWGQIIVGIYPHAPLPPWQEWYSGLLPFPWLLLSQLLLLMLMAVVNVDQARAAGRFHVERGQTRQRLRWFAAAYAASMVVRYIWRMTVLPEARWFGGTIPIGFHFVLAAWVCLLAVENRRNAGEKWVTDER
jgi:hypothetical protein